MTGLGEAAEQYAWAGVPVIPCHWPTQPAHDNPRSGCSCGRGRRCDRPGKHPLTGSGLHDATTRQATIRAWWDRWPHANIGLATGVVFDVLDIDGPAGLRTIDTLGLTGDSRVPTPVARTGGGWHYLFTPTGAGNRVRIADGLDWRGDGGYVIAPPSRHANGNLYRWVRPFDTVELARVPAPLVDLLARPEPARVHPAERTGTAPPADQHGYGQAALADECDRVRTAQPGQRNHTLNRAAFRCYQIAAAGLLDPDHITDQMAAAARHAGLGDAETRRTLASARQAGLANPRRPAPRPPTVTRAAPTRGTGRALTRDTGGDPR